MSAHSSQVHPPIHDRGWLKGRCNELRRQTTNSTLTHFQGKENQVLESHPRVYDNPLKYTRKRSPSPRPQINRIHSPNPRKRSGALLISSPSILSASVNKENPPLRPGTTEFASYATNSRIPQSARSIRLYPPIRPPDEKSGYGLLKLTFSNRASTDTRPLRSILITSPSAPSHAKRRCELSGTEYKKTAPSGHVMFKNHPTQEPHTYRHARGHKGPPGSHSTRRVAENMITTRDFDCYRREVHTVVSTLGSRVGALENTIAATLPVVAEARLLWMENAIVKTPTKLGTTRHALCECYGNPRYDTYTRRVRTRAHYLGLTLEDLEYLQERLDSLGSQSAQHDTLLISPFGGINRSGDKTMVEAYRQDSKHGAYARRVWRVCYESAYSVDEDWMLPVPIPDSPALMEKIKGWLRGP